MRTWKQLLAESVLLTEPTLVENRLILTLTAEHASARNLSSITQQWQRIYESSANFQKVFSLPQKVGQTIVLDLKKRYQRLTANQAMEKFVGFVIPELAPLTQKEMQIQRGISKKAVFRNALDQGTLFKSVRQEGVNIHLTLSDEFNAASNYPHIRSVLQALQNESEAFSSAFCDIKLSNRKPQLRLKHYESELNPANLLAFIHRPDMTVLTAVEPEVAPIAVSESYDEFFKNLPDLFADFSDDNSSPQSSPDPLLFKYTPPYVSSHFDLDALLENAINTGDSIFGNDFEEVVTERAVTIKMG